MAGERRRVVWPQAYPPRTPAGISAARHGRRAGPPASGGGLPMV